MSIRRYDKDRPSRSDKYQYLLLETIVSYEYLSSFSNQDSIGHRLNPFQYDERALEIKDQLHNRFWILAQERLTPTQFTIFRMYADGYTQWEIAKILNVCQSSITKSINGNTDYAKYPGRHHGGAIKKMQKIVAKDEEMQQLWAQLEELETEKW